MRLTMSRGLGLEWTASRNMVTNLAPHPTTAEILSARERHENLAAVGRSVDVPIRADYAGAG
ncbi:MAG: hypothetical protein ACJA07_003443 [Rhodococcus sp. (in: high G+C Gram-positive bacteria)]|jgi:hypothetical protein